MGVCMRGCLIPFVTDISSLHHPSFPSHSTGRQCSILENSLKQKPISHLWVTQLSHGWILPVNGANLLEYWRQDGIHP